MAKNFSATPAQQQGAVTIFIAVIMLVILGLMTLYTNRSVITEQRSTANEYKQALAMEAAQSGLSQFMGQINTATNWQTFFTVSGTTWTLKSSYQNTLNNKGYLNSTDNIYANDFSQPWKSAIDENLAAPVNAAATPVPGIAQSYNVYLATTSSPNTFAIVSKGCADNCNYAQAFVISNFTIGQGAICPLDINGSLTAVNNTSITAQTVGVPGYTCGISVGSASGTLGHVIGCVSSGCSPGASDNYDPPYLETGTIGKAAHFQKYFGTTQTNIMNQMEAGSKASTKTACFINGNATQVELAACTAAGLSQIYVTGNVNITAATANFGFGFPNGVTLVIGGDLNLANNTFMMYGFSYIVGNATSSFGGSFNVQGTIAFGGNVGANVSLGVYSSVQYSRVPTGAGVSSNLTVGTWRDF
ncbi:hypothetical protein IGB42_02111 [Andreprevotia sp. IGB-42]|uniref:pilus assembly PilX family protein n=1 Tax=Andreprevotia sp. IGB-42 TaxID=2497473 RepID=UPI001356F178|nr:hypothetical protein [Andreprevotia sp. IGB-42]KAF0813183.1 hypothetical protein IGB42_02111 [Andreprevotia sp. IGB-42]